MGDRIRKWIAVLLAGSILAMIQLVPAGGAVFVRENIENKEILGEKETSLQQTLHARAWVLMDADSGRILAGKDADTAYPMASTTKILTCIIALEQGNPDDWVEVSEKAASMPDPATRAEKQKWFDKLLEVQNANSARLHAAYVGKTVRVLVDGESDDEAFPLSSRTEGNRLVRLKGGRELIGQFIDVKITDSNTWALYGEPV